MQPIHLPTTLVAFVWHFMKRQKWKFALMQVLWLAWAFDQTFFPYIFGRVIDGITHYTGDKLEAWQVLSTPILWGLGLWVGVEVSFRGAGLLMAKALPQLEAEIRTEMFAHVQQHSPSYFATHFTGMIANKIADMPAALSRALDVMFTIFIPAFVGLVIAIYMFFTINSTFAVLLTVWVVVHLGVCLVCMNRASELSSIHADSRSHLQGRIVDSLGNYLNRKLFARDNHERAVLQHSQENERLKNAASTLYLERVKLYLGILTLLGPGISINGYIFYSWQHEIISVGEVVMVFNMAWNITTMVWWVGMDLPNFFKEMGVCRQALSLIRDQPGIVDVPDAKPLIVSKGKIQFEHISFRYKKEDSLFKDLSVTINPGEKIGLVGYSGSGKSTFVNLILRLFDIQEGRILIDGQDIALVQQDSLRQSISMIPQDPSLFNRTLLDNIRYGDLEASEEKVVEAAKLAHAHEFISIMEEGYHTMVGERGIKISGGQRQRIAIARAILKNAPILLLDEATSALDSITEEYIQESLMHLMKGKTTLVIAHRLSTLLNMDRILVFQDGCIVEDGSHRELVAGKGLFKSLWDSQVGGFLPDHT